MSESLIIGETCLSTRKKVQQIMERAHQDNYTILDLSQVGFISRSVADELRYYRDKDDIQIVGLNGSVKEMFDAVAGTDLVA